MNNTKSPLTNIMEIMNIVIERIEASGRNDDGKASMVSKLLAKGYTNTDINTAIGLVEMITSKIDPIVKVRDRVRTKDGNYSGVRLLNPVEAVRLTPEAQCYLLKSLEEGSVTSLEFERTLLYLEKMDLRGVTKSRLEVILLMNKPVNSQESFDVSSDIPMFCSTIH